MERPGRAFFPHGTATRAEIEARARGLVGKRLIDLQPAIAPMVPSSAATKGVVGRIYEACFDIPQNSRQGPDFDDAGVELKSVPVLVVGGEAKAKERISLTMIDFDALGSETWESASVRHKLDDLLLIFYEWSPLWPIARFRTLAAEIWRPDELTRDAIRADWERIRDLVAAGRRTDVSESLTTVLGAATKGKGHGSTSRAWALKQPFVTWIYRSMVGTAGASGLTSSRDPQTEFEHEVLSRFAPHVGRSFDRLAVTTGHEGTRGKAAVAMIVRAIAGERPRGRSGDFQRFGTEVKTVPIDSAGNLLEAMSFPAFVHEELVFESWEDSDLLGRLNRLLIVPVHRRKRASLDETVLGRAFFWSPPAADLDGIHQEWERFRSLIEQGQARDLPNASATTYIHVRPKGQNAKDRDVAPGGFDVIKKAFWLNQSYLHGVLADHDALTRPPLR